MGINLVVSIFSSLPSIILILIPVSVIIVPFIEHSRSCDLPSESIESFSRSIAGLRILLLDVIEIVPVTIIMIATVRVAVVVLRESVVVFPKFHNGFRGSFR